MQNPATLRPSHEIDSFTRLIRPKELAAQLGVGRSTLYEWLQNPDPDHPLPRPIKIGRVTAWRANDIQSWLQALPHLQAAA